MTLDARVPITLFCDANATIATFEKNAACCSGSRDVLITEGGSDVAKVGEDGEDGEEVVIVLKLWLGFLSLAIGAVKLLY